MLKKTFSLCILIFAAWMLSTQVQAATDEVIVYVHFDQSSYAANDVMTLTIHTENFVDLYGFQLDIKKDFSVFTTQTNVNPYQIPNHSIFHDLSTVWVNEVSDDIATLLVSKQLEESKGFDYNEYSVLATIKLVAVQSITNPYSILKISNNLDDLIFDMFNMVLKLSDSDANPIHYTVISAPEQPITPPEITLNPGIDTVHRLSTHVDAGIQVVFSETYEVVVNNNVNTEIVGTYLISYTVKYLDEEETVLRYVHVIEKPREVVFNLLVSLTTIPVGATFVDAGCEVSVDGVVSSCQIISNNLNTNAVGTYQIVYGVTVDDMTYTYVRYVFVFKIYQDVLFPSKKEVFEL